MSNRITKKMIERQFVNLCNALGKRVCTDWKDVGSWKLDSNPHYGGYTIVEMMEGGGQSHPISMQRHKGSEFFYMMIFALRAIAIDRNPDGHMYWPTEKTINPQVTEG
jgi:hypothetical protein